jgi:hypothetical protein
MKSFAKSFARFAAPALLLLALSGCIASSEAAHHAAAQGVLYQFVLGLWHGIIAPFTLLGEIIEKFVPNLLPWRLQMYQREGTGLAYDIGFYLGLVGSPVAIVHRNNSSRQS